MGGLRDLTMASHTEIGTSDFLTHAIIPLSIWETEGNMVQLLHRLNWQQAGR